MTGAAAPFAGIGVFVLAAGVLFVAFLVLREFWAWYWKINKAIALLERIEQNTRR